MRIPPQRESDVEIPQHPTAGASFLSYVCRRGVCGEKTTGILHKRNSAMKTTLLRLVRALWNDERGFIVSAELVLIGTIAILSMVVGLTTVSRSITRELSDIANAFDAVNQGEDDHGRYGNRHSRSDDAGIVPR